MPEVVRFDNVSKKFDDTHALRNLSLSIGSSRIVGLIGTNGSGKSTLLRHIAGIYLPTKGEVYTFGVPARKLDTKELERIGMVHQREDFLSWMRVKEMLSYVGSFYPNWDRQMEKRLCDHFELDPKAKVEKLAPGKKQRLAIVLATCHRPDLILFDEPLSDLDPLAREKILVMILDVFRENAPTMIISSHLLHDIERVIDHVICLDAGELVLDEPLDNLQERFAEWTVVSQNGRFPARFDDRWILSQHGDDHNRVLIVDDSAGQLAEFRSRYAATVEVRALNLEKIFTNVVGPKHPAIGKRA